ncbi:MAG: SusC/RagA family TonB-linked outer membrane protein [Bacteroidales bacterium]|nr:SusC/RagA family TonB-linked outer membrane protein [Bacteroidales bacterium]
MKKIKKSKFSQLAFFGLLVVCFGVSINTQATSLNKTETSQNGAEKVKIKGRVLDSVTKEGLIGVSVRVDGKAVIGTLTDPEGMFELIVPEKSTILITYIGFKKKAITASAQNSKSILTILLEEDSQNLDEVVVTGYQKIDRKMFTGAASRVKAEDAKIDGVTDVSRMIQGKAAGVQVTNVSGTFGAAPKIRVRGASSIYGNQTPLWVVDGVVLEDVVEISADDLSSGNAATLISSAVAGLNADDIENFQILKDASATALYGARAMNGVVVITTKKGKAGSAKVNYTGEFTARLKPSYETYNIMNSQDQMSVDLELQQKGYLSHAEISRAKNGGVFFKMYDLINTYDKKSGTYGLANTPEARAAYLQQAELRNTDWFNVLFRNTIQQNHSVGISSGTEKAKSYSSLSFYNDPGWTKTDYVSRFTINTNHSFDLTKKVTLGISANASVRNQRAPGTLDRSANVVEGSYNRDFDINPFSYALNSSRTLSPNTIYRMNYADFNILQEMDNNHIDLDMMDAKFQGDISYKLTKELELTALGAFRYVKSTQEHRIMDNSNMSMAYRAAQDATIRGNNNFLYRDPDNVDALPEVVMPEGGFYNTEDNRLLNYYFRSTANYNKIFGEKHAVNGMIGQEVKYTDRSNRFAKGVGYQYDNGGIPYVDYRMLRQMVEGGDNYYGMSEMFDRYVAFFGTASYSYNGTYVVNATARYDGSNRLGRSKSARWLPTWNLSGSWNIANESFLRDNEVISTLSLRGTYGLVASMGPATNALTIFRNEMTYRPFTSEKENKIYIESLENSELTWEKQHELNVGLDFGLFRNRISLSLDAYQRRGFDLIGLVRTSGIGGELTKFANYANMSSEGVEFSLNNKIIASRNFNWSTNITFSYNTNKITNLKSQPRIIDMVSAEGAAREGYPVRGLFSVQFDGLNSEGLPTFINEYGEKTIGNIWFQERDSINHLKYEGSIDPKYTGGLESSVSYKNLKLDLYFTYQFGNVIRLNPVFRSSYSDLDAMPNEFKNRWMLPGDENFTNIPVIPSSRQNSDYTDLGIAYNAYNYSDVRIAKGDYIRLKDISLSYDLKSLSKYLKINSIQLKLVASNVWLMYADKKLGGQDPEFFRSGGVAMPMPRQFTFSLRVGM